MVRSRIYPADVSPVCSRRTESRCRMRISPASPTRARWTWAISPGRTQVRQALLYSSSCSGKFPNMPIITLMFKLKLKSNQSEKCNGKQSFRLCIPNERHFFSHSKLRPNRCRWRLGYYWQSTESRHRHNIQWYHRIPPRLVVLPHCILLQATTTTRTTTMPNAR